MQFPYPPIPATTPLKRYRLRAACSGVVCGRYACIGTPGCGSGGSVGCSGPKRSESSSATGRAPIAKMSRTMPPTPVAAPSYGSMADGWLCDSILKATHSPSPMSMTPAFSSPTLVSTPAPSDGNIFSSGRLFLYPQCSDHIAPNMPSSTSFGSRSSRSMMRSYSSRESESWSRVSWSGGTSQVSACVNWAPARARPITRIRRRGYRRFGSSSARRGSRWMAR